MKGIKKVSLGGLLTATLIATSLVAISPAQAAKPVVIWCDNARVAIIKAWASQSAVKAKLGTINVVGQDSVKASLKTVRPVDAPDIILGAHDWIGALKASNMIVPVVLPATAKYAPTVKAAFQINGKQYGVPMQTENVALFRNTALVPKAPKTFAELEKVALALKKKKGSKFIPLAVPQGAGGDAYHMYPLFSGLGGYFFGGNTLKWNTNDIGVANAKFLKNSGIIAKWYKEGLIKASVSSDVAKSSFTGGNAAFYITGPWNLGSIRASGVPYAISGFPTIVNGIKPVPLVGVQGAMLTKWAATHGVVAPSRKVLTELAGVDAQTFISNLMLRPPANLTALGKYNRPGANEFQAAGKGGIPMAAMTAMNAVWAAVGTAWVKSTSGNPTAASVASAFKAAATSVKKAVK